MISYTGMRRGVRSLAKVFDLVSQSTRPPRFSHELCGIVVLSNLEVCVSFDLAGTTLSATIQQRRFGASFGTDRMHTLEGGRTILARMSTDDAYKSTRKKSHPAVVDSWQGRSATFTSQKLPQCVSPQRHTSTKSSPNDYFSLLSKGLPVWVGNSARGGRGVFATQSFVAGDGMHVAVPVVAHPSLDCVDQVCYHCLADLDSHEASDAGSSICDTDGDGDGDESPSTAASVCQPLARFCSSGCRDMAVESFYGVESAAAWSAFIRHCRKEKVKFPLLVRRLVCLILSGAASANALKPLCYVHPPLPMLEHCRLQHRLLRAPLAAHLPPQDLQFLTPEWYAGVMGRLHLNCFRVPGRANEEGSQRGTGSAVYLLASMYNHDCDPNVEIQWPNGAGAELRARKDVNAGEELCITYIDANVSRARRQQELHQAYGFLCKCQRCEQESESEMSIRNKVCDKGCV